MSRQSRVRRRDRGGRRGQGFPLDRVSFRVLPADWCGEVFICDVDRTYLDTRFSSLRGMARIPLEGAADKRTIPGMAALLKEIRRGPGAVSRHTPLFFVSASPVRLRPVIERKMLLDGVEQDGTTFKSWRGVLRARKLGRLRDQVGFKLTALLASRRALPLGAREVLIGDDLEADPFTFRLYADLLSRRISAAEGRRIMLERRVLAEDIAHILETLKGIAPVDGVARILIRVERDRDPALSEPGDGLLVPCRSARQLALALWGQGSIAWEGVARVARAAGRPPSDEDLAQLMHLGGLSPERGALARGRVAGQGLVSESEKV